MSEYPLSLAEWFDEFDFFYERYGSYKPFYPRYPTMVAVWDNHLQYVVADTYPWVEAEVEDFSTLAEWWDWIGEYDAVPYDPESLI